MIKVDYVGKQNGEVFDLTVEDQAEKEGLDTEGMNFDPINVLIGENFVIEGLEEALKDMEVGEEKEVEIPAEKAYGERDSDRLETFPEKAFEKQGVQVRPGEQLMIGGERGRVISKGSGRVKIDFNHPLAGKDLEYWVKIVGKVEDDEEIAQGILDNRLGHGEIEFEEDTATIIHEHDDHAHSLNEEFKERMREEILEYTGFENVEFKE